MKVKQLILATALGTSITAPAMADDGVLTGDTRLACEAIICLATGTRPSECSPSLQRYFSISYKKWSDTLQGRIDFLNMCPAASQDSQMGTLVNAIANGAGSCDVASLNSSQMWSGGDNGGFYINNAMPGVCTTYANHAYTDLKKTLPVYVGVPDRHGYWVAPENYGPALAEYNARIAAENAAAQSY